FSQGCHGIIHQFTATFARGNIGRREKNSDAELLSQRCRNFIAIWFEPVQYDIKFSRSRKFCGNAQTNATGGAGYQYLLFHKSESTVKVTITGDCAADRQRLRLQLYASFKSGTS